MVSKVILVLVILCVFIVFNLFFIYALLEVAIEKYLLNMFVPIKQSPWKISVKVFIVTKVAGCRPLSLLKLTLSQICFKSSAKITYYLVF